MDSLSNADPAQELSDEVLLSAIAGGAIWAMEALYARHSRTLYSLAYRMVANHEVAEDLLQEAFLAVWRRSISYSPQTGAARNWLVSILHHRAIDHLRGLQRRSHMQEVPLDEVEFDERIAAPDVWDEAWRSVQSSRVHTALLYIPPQQRLVIELAYFRGWTHTEIAERMQMPLGTVKARMRLGLQHLKKRLQQAGIDEV